MPKPTVAMSANESSKSADELEHHVRAIAKGYEIASGSPGAGELDRLRAQLAEAVVVAAARDANGYSDSELMAACRRQIERSSLSKFGEGLGDALKEMSPAGVQALYDIAKHRFAASIEEATQNLFEVLLPASRAERCEIWLKALVAIERIERVRLGCAGEISAAVH